MSDQLEGNPKPEGTTESPTSPASSGQAQLSEATIQALIDRGIEKGLRGLQKGLDKQVSHVEDNVIKRVLELKEEGLSEERIRRELWIDSQMDHQNASAPPAPGRAEGAQAPVAVDAKVIEEYGLDAKDPDVSALTAKAFSSADEAEKAILKLALRKAQSPNPSRAQEAANNGGTQGTTTPEKELTVLLEQWEQVKFNPGNPLYKEIRDKLFPKDGGTKKQ